MKKILLQIVGYTSVILGFIGVVVPMLPTTPFLLLAVYCFSRSSPRMNRWLLGNHIFGKYLRNFEDGRGIPLTIKIAANITLWSSILFTAIVLLDEWWLRLLLISIATFVTVHIMKIKTLRRIRRILILVPTDIEIGSIRGDLSPHVKIAVCGIGAYKTAYCTTKMIKTERPQMVILAGIAGAYKNSGLKIGDTVAVSSECSADMGSFASGGFTPKFSEVYTCSSITTYTTLPQVESNSVSVAAAPFIGKDGEGDLLTRPNCNSQCIPVSDSLSDTKNGEEREELNGNSKSGSAQKVAKIENMEGAAFFYCCKQTKIPFLEIRTISNFVGDEMSKWNIPLATSNLGVELKRLINEIKA